MLIRTHQGQKVTASRENKLATGRSSMLLALLLVLTSCKPQEHEYTTRLRDLLGADFDAKMVAVRDDTTILTLNLNTLEIRDLGKYDPAERFEGLSRPCWSPDGNQIVFSYRARCFIMNADGSNKRRILRSRPRVYRPSFWQDPLTGDLCIVFNDRNSKNGLTRGKYGNTVLAYLRTAETKTLFDIPCDAGLSPDGTHLGETYSDAAIIDLTTEKIYKPHDTQTCNSSMSPDNTYRLMFLGLPHNRFMIKNKYGKELWSIRNPEGSQEWQSPRWSNHPDYCCAVAKFDNGYKIVIIRISTGKMVVLSGLEGNWRAPYLWLASGVPEVGEDAAGAKRSRVTIATVEQAQSMLKEAERCENAQQAKAIYMEIADRFAGTPVAEQAQAVLASPAFKKELEAEPSLSQLYALTDRLRPVVGGKSRFDDTAYFGRNRALLVRMVNLANVLRKNYPGTKAGLYATRIAGQYALPEKMERSVSDKIELIAVIEAVSRVPTAEQIAPYREALTYIRYKVGRIIDGEYNETRMIVVHWGMKEGKHTPAAGWRPGVRQHLTVDSFGSHPELDRITQASDADDVTLVPYWALDVRSESR